MTSAGGHPFSNSGGGSSSNPFHNNNNVMKADPASNCHQAIHASPVNGGDVGLLIAQWGQENPTVADLNGDGTVDAADLGLMLGYWRSCP